MSSYTGDSTANSLKPFVLVATILFALVGAAVWYMSTLENPMLGQNKVMQQEAAHPKATSNVTLPR